MNVDLIKNKLNELSTPKGNNSNKKDEKAISFWKPTVGKQLVRFVPSKSNPENPFTEIYFHYGIGKRTIISPLNFGEKDPIVEFAKELRKTKDSENWKLAKKLEPKMRVFAPVIVRGEEEKGVRLWEFGKEVYQSLLSLAADEEVGDFTDIMEGRDMKIETTGPDQNGTAYNKSKVLPALKTSTLTDDKGELDKWLSTQPEPNSFYKKYTFEEIKEFLAEYLTPEEESQPENAGDQFLSIPKVVPTQNKAFEQEDNIMDGPATDFEPSPATKTNVSKKPEMVAKQNAAFAADEFDELFN
jgi:hypothetical protein